MKMAKLPRLMRLMKTLRILKIAKIGKLRNWVQNILNKYSITGAVGRQVKSLLFLILIVHVFSCMYFAVEEIIGVSAGDL